MAHTAPRQERGGAKVKFWSKYTYEGSIPLTIKREQIMFRAPQKRSFVLKLILFCLLSKLIYIVHFQTRNTQLWHFLVMNSHFYLLWMNKTFKGSPGRNEVFLFLPACLPYWVHCTAGTHKGSHVKLHFAALRDRL